MPDLALPRSYREDLIKPLVAALRSGECCSLVGVSSSGKSNLFRFLSRADVREQYLGGAAATTLFVHVDGNRLAARTPMAFYASFVEALAQALGAPEYRDLQAHVEAYWDQIISTHKEPLARRCVDSALAEVFAGPVEQLIVLFDDWDALTAHAPASLFRTWRALRDNAKTRLVYLTITRRELASLRAASPDLESFAELFSSHVFGITPYRRADAEFMLTRLAARQIGARPLSPTETDRLLEFSGHHAGLLKALYFASKLGELAVHPNALALFARDDSVWSECVKIWDSLGPEEQTGCQAIVTGGSPARDVLRTLKLKGLVSERTDGTFAIFSPLFLIYVAAHIRGDRESTGPIIALLPALPGIMLDGRMAPLTDLEYALLQPLYQRRPHGCTRAELIEHLLRAEAGQRAGTGGPERRLEYVMEEIRKKIEIPGRLYIIPDSEGGYRFVRDNGA